MALDPRFRGFPDDAIAFYEGLEADNSKAYWTANKQVYDEVVPAPMQALLDAVEPEFGAGSIFRPYRDVRFSRDKSPYKTHIGATIGELQGAVYYVQLSADGLMAAPGLHGPDPSQVERFREAVDDDSAGGDLLGIVEAVEKAGYEVGGEALKTAPRGYPLDHPRIRFLRHKGLYASKSWPPAKWLGTAKALDRVIETWRGLAPLTQWLDKHVGSA
ncbi:MAG: DUF2461 domain-containing protein [Actinomycetes bacterium]